MPNDDGKSPLSPTAVPLADAARLLSKIGNQFIEPEMLVEDIQDGAPTNPDGSLNLVYYAAWLVKEMSRRGH